MPPQKARPTQKKRFGMIGKRPVVKRQDIVEKGLLRLNSIGSTMMHKELVALQKQAAKGNVHSENVVERIEGMRRLEHKRTGLMRHWLRRGAHLTTLDKDFPVVMNRKAFMTRLEKILSKDKQNGFHSLVFFDIDSLKKINTRFGRIKGGHEFLITFSQALATTAKATKGFAGHVYGDEFLAYLPWPPALVQEILQTVFEQHRQRELHKWSMYRPAKAHGVAFNYSAGIVGLRAGDSVAEAMIVADKLCDSAKIQGREKNTFATFGDMSKMKK